MNILLWIVQVVLALLCLAGGAFKATNPGDVAQQISALPRAAWRALGVFEVLAALLLVGPAAIGWLPALTPLAAAALALETLLLALVYARYSLRLTAANPLVFAVPMFLMAAFVAYGRYALLAP